VDLREAIITVSRNWKTVGGDSNLLDVIFQAHHMAKTCGIQVPTDLPTKEAGVRLVETVDRELIKGDLIRTLPPEELARRGEAVVRAIESEDLLTAYEAVVKYIVALYTWHGCIHIAKATRRTHRTATGEDPYTPELRRQGYALVQQWWKEAESVGNPWVKFGVSLARRLEQGRGHQPVDNWVPRDSPYWKE
jgi:hypothetical protein